MLLTYMASSPEVLKRRLKDRGLCSTCEHMQINPLAGEFLWLWWGRRSRVCLCVSACSPQLVYHPSRNRAWRLLSSSLLPSLGLVPWWALLPRLHYPEMVCFLWLSTIPAKKHELSLCLQQSEFSGFQGHLQFKIFPSPCHHNCTSAG